MSILLFVVGAAALAAGATMVGFGIPINEFSFGNTLIVSGTTAVAAGLIVLSIGVAVMYLQRIAEALAARPAIRPNRPFETFEGAAARPAANPARVPFPAKKQAVAKTELPPREPPAPEPQPEPFVQAEIPVSRQPDPFAPSLPNPDEPPVAIEDEVSLSPQQPVAPAEPKAEAGRRLPPFFRSSRSEPEPPAAVENDWRPPPPVSAPPPRKAPASYFDAMWPAGPKVPEPDQATSAEPPPGDTTPVEAEPAEPARADIGRVEAQQADGEAPPAMRQPSDFVEPAEAEPHAVAILKSGVVDGMGYTLYVDGSIEAELPQGTLRFASINELRSHLEKTS